MIQYKIVEDVLGAVSSTKDNEVLDQSAKALCKLSDNNDVVVELLRLN